MADLRSETNLSHEHAGIQKHDEGFKIAILTCLGVAAVVGLLGNGLVVAVILRAKKMRSVMNRFILHLAISDLIVSTVAIPLFLVVNFKEGIGMKSYSLPICKVARFFQYLSPEASMTLLITIGWNRHQAVVHPLNIMSYGTANKLILGAWVYALLIVSPSLYLTVLKDAPLDPNTNETFTYCATIPATTLPGLIYVMFLGLFGYLFPLATLIVLYGKIYRTVWRRKSGQLGDSRPVEAFIRSRKKVLKMFLTVILVFLVTWLPLLIYISAIEWTVKSTTSHVDYVRLITYSLGLCNSICNPFIYALFNGKFRAGCKDMFTWSVNAAQRGKKSPHGENVAANGARRIREAQNVFTRRGGFHGTKGDENKKPKNSSKKEEESTKESTQSSSLSVNNIIGRRFRSLTDVDCYKGSGSTEVIELVRYKKTIDPDEVFTDFSQSSPKKNRAKNGDNLVRFTNEGYSPIMTNGDSDASGNRKVEKSKDGYNILKEDPASLTAEKRARTKSEGYDYKKTKRGLPEQRIFSTPAAFH